MAVDLPEVHVGALNTTRVLVAGVGADQWAGPTPCEDWDVRTLVNHIVTGNWWAAELAAGRTIEEVGPRLDGDVLADDPTGAYDASAAAAAAVFREPARWSGRARCRTARCRARSTAGTGSSTS